LPGAGVGPSTPAIVVTDDLGMHELAREFNIGVWHGFDLLAKLRTAKAVSDELVREIYAALEANGDCGRRCERAEFWPVSKC
jgi:hypothetical protein